MFMLGSVQSAFVPWSLVLGLTIIEELLVQDSRPSA
jgi:hypothetical protein